MENWVLEIFESAYYCRIDCGAQRSNCGCTEHSSKICGFVNILNCWCWLMEFEADKLTSDPFLKEYRIEWDNKLAVGWTYIHILLTLLMCPIFCCLIYRTTTFDASDWNLKFCDYWKLKLEYYKWILATEWYTRPYLFLAVASLFDCINRHGIFFI